METVRKKLEITVGERLAVALSAAVLGACGAQGPGPDAPNVLLITLDTVRADRLGAYGYSARDVTPNLDALAEEGVVFENAFANSSYTPPSHASIMTSLYPSEHGLLSWDRSLADVTTAADLFASAGYRTAAFTPMEVLFTLGLDQGFERKGAAPPQVSGGSYVMAMGAEVNELALPFLQGESDRPFFAWVHYFDAHRPYGWQGRQWAKRFGVHTDSSVGDTEDYYQLTPEERERLKVTDEEVAWLKDRYDGGLSYLDGQIGALIDELRETGVLERTIVVITADHGEVFDEHPEEWFSHDPHLFDENLSVPLLLRLPGAEHAGTRVDALAQGVDVLPTLLELSGLPPTGARLSGASLVPTLEGGATGREFVFAEREGQNMAGSGESEEKIIAERNRKRMIRTDSLKLVHFVESQTFELYEVGDEDRDVSTERADDTRRMVEHYRLHLDGLVPVDEQDSRMDDQVEGLLRKLGYVD